MSKDSKINAQVVFATDYEEVDAKELKADGIIHDHEYEYTYHGEQLSSLSEIDDEYYPTPKDAPPLRAHFSVIHLREAAKNLAAENSKKNYAKLKIACKEFEQHLFKQNQQYFSEVDKLYLTELRNFLRPSEITKLNEQEFRDTLNVFLPVDKEFPDTLSFFRNAIRFYLMDSSFQPDGKGTDTNLQGKFLPLIEPYIKALEHSLRFTRDGRWYGFKKRLGFTPDKETLTFEDQVYLQFIYDLLNVLKRPTIDRSDFEKIRELLVQAILEGTIPPIIDPKTLSADEYDPDDYEDEESQNSDEDAKSTTRSAISTRVSLSPATDSSDSDEEGEHRETKSSSRRSSAASASSEPEIKRQDSHYQEEDLFHPFGKKHQGTLSVEQKHIPIVETLNIIKQKALTAINDHQIIVANLCKEIIQNYADGLTSETKPLSNFKRLWTGHYYDGQYQKAPKGCKGIKESLIEVVEQLALIDSYFVDQLQNFLQDYQGTAGELPQILLNFFNDSFTTSVQKSYYTDLENLEKFYLENLYLHFYLSGDERDAKRHLTHNVMNQSFVNYAHAVLYDDDAKIAEQKPLLIQAMESYYLARIKGAIRHQENTAVTSAKLLQYCQVEIFGTKPATDVDLTAQEYREIRDRYFRNQNFSQYYIAEKIEKLDYDLEFFTKENLENAKQQIDSRLKSLKKSINHFAEHNGLPRHLIAVKKKDPQTLAGLDKRGKFYHPPYMHVENPDATRLVSTSHRQQTRYTKERNKKISKISAHMLGAGEGIVAGVGGQQFLSGQGSGSIAAYGFGLISGSSGYYTNKTLVEDDTYTSLNRASFGTLFKNATAKQKFLLVMVAILSLLSGLAYGALSSYAVYSVLIKTVLMKIGLSATVALSIGFPLASPIIITTTIAMFSLLFVALRDLVMNGNKSVLGKYFRKHFHFFKGTGWGEFVINCLLFAPRFIWEVTLLALAIAVTVIISGISLKLFGTSVLTFFADVLSWRDKAASAISMLITWGNMGINSIFYLKKNISLMNLLTLRNVCMIVPGILELIGKTLIAPFTREMPNISLTRKLVYKFVRGETYSRIDDKELPKDPGLNKNQYQQKDSSYTTAHKIAGGTTVALNGTSQGMLFGSPKAGGLELARVVKVSPTASIAIATIAQASSSSSANGAAMFATIRSGERVALRSHPKKAAEEKAAGSLSTTTEEKYSTVSRRTSTSTTSSSRASSIDSRRSSAADEAQPQAEPKQEIAVSKITQHCNRRWLSIFTEESTTETKQRDIERVANSSVVAR